MRAWNSAYKIISFDDFVGWVLDDFIWSNNTNYKLSFHWHQYIYIFIYLLAARCLNLRSVVVSTPVCHAGDQGSTLTCGVFFSLIIFFFFCQIVLYVRPWSLKSTFLCAVLFIFMPPLKKEGHIALHMSVGMSVSLKLVQLITQECFAQVVSNLVHVGR